MARTEVLRQIEVTLIMDEKEARWLHSLLQNPLVERGDLESLESYEYRSSIWQALNRDLGRG
jgi:hypothetical protein